ncbi:MAG: hypothetical protein ABGZ49_06910 [Akkermansiaceae bacterium]
MRILLALSLLLPTLLTAAPVTPKAGSKEYLAIIAAVSDPVEDAVHQPVKLEVKHLKMENGWAFLDAVPLTKAGKQMTYQGTMFEEWTEDADEVLWVLLRFKRGRWYIVEKVFFTTEATWVDWAKYFRAPPAIFPKLNID